MRELEQAVALLSKLPECPFEIQLSPALHDAILRESGRVIPPEFPTFYGMRLTVNRYFKPDWWAERYRDRTVIHTGGESIVIPDMTFGPKP